MPICAGLKAREFAKRLVEAGVVHPRCREFTLKMAVDDAATIEQTVYAEDGEIEKITTILEDILQSKK